MDASIVFVAAMCSDDGRALTGTWNVYTRETRLRGTNAFWNYPHYCISEEEARGYCAENGFEIVSVRWG